MQYDRISQWPRLAAATLLVFFYSLGVAAGPNEAQKREVERRVEEKKTEQVKEVRRETEKAQTEKREIIQRQVRERSAATADKQSAKSAAAGREKVLHERATGKEVPAAARTTEHTPTGVSGKKGFELQNASYQKTRNKAEVINGRPYSGHALDQMQNRGMTPSVVEHTIDHGKPFEARDGAKGYYDKENKTQAIVNPESGNVITTRSGPPKKQ